MSNRITKSQVEAAVPVSGRDIWLWDGEAKGFGLRVRPSGRKVYIVEYRPGAGGRSAPKRRHTIGAHGSPWTPDMARNEARRILALVSQGKDPSAERAAARKRDGDTVDDFMALFIDKYARKRQKSWRETERVFRHDVSPAIGRKLLGEVTRQDIVHLLDDIAERGPVMANRTLAYTRRFFNWCIERGYTSDNPCAALKPFGTNGSRERVLSDDELAEVWLAAEQCNTVWSSILKLLILTGQRRAEVGEMRWAEIDLDARTWTLPAERTKNKRSHEVPLTESVVNIITDIPPLEYDGGGGFMRESTLVFTTTGKTPFSGYSRAKETLDRKILEIRISDNPDAKAMEGWTLHDLRRTVVTGMARLGVHPHIADALLNHKEGIIRGVAAVYNRHAYLEERRDALEQWEQHVLEAVCGLSPAKTNGSKAK